MAARILVVDDEKVVLDLIRHALSGRGYEVVCTADPVQAIATAAASPGMDLIVSDVVMPGMRGTELVKKIKEASPGIAALLMSGFAIGPDVPEDVPFISKPFRIQDLVRSIEKLLTADGSHAAGETTRAKAAGSNGSAGSGG